jgi:ADP-ribosyl-[dinitrogen reductase] hydrolase
MSIPTTEDRIKAALLAYAAGDAAGVPWEGLPPKEIQRDRIAELPNNIAGYQRGDPVGSVSDDTEQTIVVARYLIDQGPVLDPAEFLMRLAATSMRGIGPSTRAAIERFRCTGELYATTGDTNGAPMRILPVGWAISDPVKRREIARGLSRTTHGGERALASACVMAAMASATLEPDATIPSVIEAACIEMTHQQEDLCAPIWRTTGSDMPQAVQAAHTYAMGLNNDMYPPDMDWDMRRKRRFDPVINDHMNLDAVDTVANVVYVLRQTYRSRDRLNRINVADGIRTAVSLGWDTDTVAAMVGGLLGGLTGDVSSIHWLAQTEQPDTAELDAIASGLAQLRKQLDHH